MMRPSSGSKKQPNRTLKVHISTLAFAIWTAWVLKQTLKNPFPIFPNPMKTKKMNILFYESSGLKLNFVIDYGTEIKDVLDKFSQRVGIPKFNFYFYDNRGTLKYDDERKIEDHFIDGEQITAIRFK